MSMASLPRVDRTFLWWERFSTRSRVLVSWRAFKSSKVLRRRRLQYHCPWRLNLETRQVWSTSTPWTNPSWFHTKISHCLEVRNKTVNLKHNDKRTCVFKTESKSNYVISRDYESKNCRLACRKTDFGLTPNVKSQETLRVPVPCHC